MLVTKYLRDTESLQLFQHSDEGGQQGMNGSRLVQLCAFGRLGQANESVGPWKN